MASKVGSGIGPVVTGLPQSTDVQQLQQQQKPQVKADIGALQIGFFKEGGAKVVADGSRVRNPILDGDEEFPAMDEGMGRSMKGLSTKLALQLEDFGSEKSGGGLQGFASFFLEKNNNPDEAGVAQLQQLADRQGPQLPDSGQLSALRSQLQSNLGVTLPAEASFGQLSLVAGLAAAGIDPQTVLGPNGELDTNALSGQLSDVVRKGGEALEEGLTMSAGVSTLVSQARTTIFKR